MYRIYLFFLFIFLSFNLFADWRAFPHHNLPPDLTSEEYYQLLRQSQDGEKSLTQKLESSADPRIAPSLNMGQTLLSWLEHMNAKRPPEKKLKYTKKGEARAFPIESPNIYNPEKIQREYNETLTTLPENLKGILLNQKPFTDNPPLPDDEFIALTKPIRRNYDSASRWMLVFPYLDHYERRANGDVRGYYFLNRTPDLQQQLATFYGLPFGKQQQFKSWLIQLCGNGGIRWDQCQQELDSDIDERKDLNSYYQKYLMFGSTQWNAFFRIRMMRSDIQWSSKAPNITSIPFFDPNSARIRSFVKKNLEEEWRHSPWELKIVFDPRAVINLSFEQGVAPHVDRLGGNNIVMDSNMSLDEPEVQWIIRHEFGHVLGLPDCYFEFYDRSQAAMINYQLDVTDLMCSRAGKMNQRIFDELKRVYFQ